MVLIEKSTYKNVTCEIYADKVGESYLKKLHYGYEITTPNAAQQAYLYYNSPKNENRRVKVTITQKLFAVSNQEAKAMINSSNRSFDNLCNNYYYYYLPMLMNIHRYMIVVV